MLEPLDLMRNYKQVYSLKTVSGKDKLLYLEYKSRKHHIEGVYYSNNIYKIESGNQIGTCICLDNKSLYDLLNLFEKDRHTLLTILNYNNAKTKSPDGYIVDLGSIQLSFEKDKICTWDEDRKLNVYGEIDGILNVEDLKEKYNILKNGYICDNIVDSMRTRCFIGNNNCNFINYKLFHKRREREFANNLTLGDQPTLIESNEIKISCRYDKYGMMMSCEKSEFNIENSCNYKKKETVGRTYITSIHPHIIDRFNLDCEDLENYITYDALSLDNNSTVFSRTVYKK